MTFPEIGALIGLAPSSVSDIEHGYTKVPGGDAALRLVELHRSKFAESTTRKCG